MISLAKEIENQPTVVEITKTDITDDKEVEGEKLQILDKDGEIVEEWVSTKESRKVYALEPGEYILHEEAAPEGYLVVSDVPSVVEETGEIQKVEIKDERPSGQLLIQKTDAENKAPLADVEFELRNQATGEIVETLVTGEDGTAKSGELPIGIYEEGAFVEPIVYVLVETKPLEGYEVNTEEVEVVFEYQDDETKIIEATEEIENARKPGTPPPDAPKTGDDTRAWLIGGFGIINGVLTIGTVTALINYQGMLISPMAFFSEFNNSYQGTVIALKRLYSVLYFEEENNEGTAIRSNNIEKVEFHDVSFRYRKDVPVLDHVNIQLRKGNIVGFIGGSGCGKSSLVKMLLRLYAPYKGTISIDGEKIQDISINSLRNRIAFVAQDSLFFRGSILENLKMGNVVDNTKLIEYSKLLDLYDEIVRLPKKWDTELNAGTSNLSGGQKKRLDVLRALMKESDIIIFDESTASIDIERRKRLFEILDKIKQEKIIIFITHNIEECVYCDQIYAVKNQSVQQISYKNLSEAYS